MNFEIKYSKSTSGQAAFETIQEIITDQLLWESYKIKAKINYDCESLTMFAKGNGFDLTITFKETIAEGNLKVGFLLRALSRSIVNKIQKAIEGKI